MKVAIIGSRGLQPTINIEPKPDEIISGGAKGVDTCAAIYAKENGIKLTEVLPDYKKHFKSAPLIRNQQIVEMADIVYAYWDSKSRGTLFTINYAKKLKKPVIIAQ